MTTTGATSRPTIEQTMLEVAQVLARRGTCPRRQVGAVLVDCFNRILSTGYNGAPRGEPHCTTNASCPGAFQRSGAGLDLCEAVHAEANALLSCSDITRARTIYATVSPCAGCVKLLLNTGVTRVYFLEEYPHEHARERWVRAGRLWVRLIGGTS